MGTRFVGSLLLAFTVLLLASPAAAGLDGGIESFHHRRLDNGLEVYIGVDHRVPLVALSVLYKLGTALDPAGQRGLTRVIARVLPFTATRHLPSGRASALMEAAGFDPWLMDSSAGPDRVSLFGTVPAEALEPALWMEAERMGFAATGLDPRHLAWAKEQVAEEDRKQDLVTRAGQRMSQLLWSTTHPYRAPFAATDLDRINLDAVRAHLQRYFHPGNAALAVVGDVDPERTLQLIEQTFGRVRGGAPVKVRARGVAKQAGVVRGEQRAERDVVGFAWRTAAFLTEDDVTLDVVAHYLRRRLKARLGEANAGSVGLVRQRSDHLASHFVVFAHPTPGTTVDHVQSLVQAELARAARAEIDDRDLDAGRNGIITTIATTQEGLPDRARTLNSFAWSRHDPNGFAWYFGGYRATDRERLAAVVRKYLVAQPQGTLHIAAKPSAPEQGRLTTPEPKWVAAAPQGAGPPPTADDDAWYRPPRPSKLRRFTVPTPLDTRLPGGTRLIVAEHLGLPVVRVVAEVRWGAVRPSAPVRYLVQESLQRAPLAGQETLATRLDRLGASLDVTATAGALSLQIAVHPEQLDSALVQLAQLLETTTFAEDDFARRHRALVDELDGWEPSSRLLLDRWVHTVSVAPTHPSYVAPPWIEREQVARLQREDAQQAWADCRRLGHLSYLLVGNVRPDQAEQLVAAHLPRWPAGSQRPPTGPEYRHGVFLADDPRMTVAEVELRWSAPGRNDADYAPGVAVRSLLETRVPGGLAERHREQNVTSIEDGITLLTCEGTSCWLALRARMKPADVEGHTRAVLAQIERLAQGDYPSLSLARARNGTRAYFVRQHESTRSEATLLSSLLSTDLTARALQGAYDGAGRTSPEDIQRIASSLAPDQLTLVVYGPADTYEAGLRAQQLGVVTRVSAVPPGKESSP